MPRAELHRDAERESDVVWIGPERVEPYDPDGATRIVWAD